MFFLVKYFRLAIEKLLEQLLHKFLEKFLETFMKKQNNHLWGTARFRVPVACTIFPILSFTTPAYKSIELSICNAIFWVDVLILGKIVSFNSCIVCSIHCLLLRCIHIAIIVVVAVVVIIVYFRVVSLFDLKKCLFRQN